MVIRRKDGPDGPEYYRPPFRPEDYTVHPTSMKGIENWRGGQYSVDDLIGDREGPFVGWDLRGVDLAGCDLTGARFIGCTLGGAHGVPRATAGWEVVNVDLSEAGDGSDPADAAELLDELTAS